MFGVHSIVAWFAAIRGKRHTVRMRRIRLLIFTYPHVDVSPLQGYDVKRRNNVFRVKNDGIFFGQNCTQQKCKDFAHR